MTAAVAPPRLEANFMTMLRNLMHLCNAQTNKVLTVGEGVTLATGLTTVYEDSLLADLPKNGGNKLTVMVKMHIRTLRNRVLYPTYIRI